MNTLNHNFQPNHMQKMTEERVLIMAKKILKRRIRKFFLRLTYELLRAFFTFIFGILIVASAVIVVLLTKDNGVYDIGALIICLPLAVFVTAEKWKEFYTKGDSNESNVYNG